MNDTRPVAKRALITLVIIAAFTAALSIINIFCHTKVDVSSDTVSMLPAAQEIADGNIFLAGWIMGTNNFLFTETIFYAIGYLMGASSEAMITVICPVFFSAAIAFCGTVFILRDERYMAPRVDGGNDGTSAPMGASRKITAPKHRSPARARIIAAIIYIATFGIMSYYGAHFALNANSHTHLYLFVPICIMLMFLWYDRGKKKYVAIYAIIAILIIFSEGFAAIVLTGPVALFTLGLMIAKKKERKKSLVMFVANAASWFGAFAMTKIVEASGGVVTLGKATHILAPGAQTAGRVVENIEVSKWFTGFQGFNAIAEGGTQAVFQTVFFVMMLLFALGIVLAFVNISRLTRVDAIMLLICICNVAVVLFTDADITARYLEPTVIFGGIVAVRQLVFSARAIYAKKRVAGVAVSAVLLALCVLDTVGVFGHYLALPDANEKEKEVAAYLEENNCGDGYGTFFTASLLSYFSGNPTKILPMIINQDGVYRYFELVRTEWYNDFGRSYIVLDKADMEPNVRWGDEDRLEYIKKYVGEPDSVEEVSGYTIAFYNNKDIASYLGEYTTE